MNSEEQKILDIKVRYSDALEGIQRYKEEVKKLNEAEAELNEESENYEAELELINAQRNEARANIRALRKEIQNNIRIEKEQEGSLKRLRAELSNATKAYDALSREERETAKGKELEKHINDITTELKDAEEATQRFYRNVGNYQNSIMEAIGLNGGFGQSLMSLTDGAKTIGGAVQNMIGSVKAFGTALLGLLTNPVFLAIAGIAGAGVAFKWWWDYNEGLEKATRLTAQFTGLAGDELKQYRNEVQAVADTYEKDFSEVLTSANALSKQFGIEQSEAIKLVREGFAAGGDMSDEYLEGIKEYSAFFKQAGLTADEFLSVSINATKQGIFSDKGLDAIKEADTKLREMSTATREALEGVGISSEEVLKGLSDGSLTTFEVMQQVSEKLNDTTVNADKAAAVVADVFGSAGEDAGRQYIAMLKDMNTSFEETKKQAGYLYDTQEQIVESEVRLQNAISGLFDDTGGTFEQMKADAISFVNDGLASVIEGVRSLIDWFKNFYNESTIIRGFINYVGFAFQNLGLVVKNSVSGVVEIVKLWADVWRGLYTMDFDRIEDAWNRYTTYFKNTATEMGETIRKNFEEALAETMNGAVTTASAGTLPDRLPTTDEIATETGKKIAGGGGNGDVVAEIIKANKEEIDKRAELIKMRLQLVKEGTEEEYRLKLEQLRMEKELEDERIRNEYTSAEQEREALRLNGELYKQQVAQLNEEKRQAMIDALTANAEATMQIMSEQTQQEVEVQQMKADAIRQIVGSLSDFMVMAAERNEALAGVAKALAIAEILIAQGVAIANAVKTVASSSATWWEILPAIGTIIGAITSVMSTAMKSVNKAKVRGSGSGSGSLGGSAQMSFRPMLNSYTGMAGNVVNVGGQMPQQTMSEATIASAVNEGVKNQPAPVVSVVEITEVQNRVRTIEETDVL